MEALWNLKQVRVCLLILAVSLATQAVLKDLLSTLNCKTSLVFLQDLLVNEPMLSHLLKCVYSLKSEEAPVSSV